MFGDLWSRPRDADRGMREQIVRDDEFADGCARVTLASRRRRLTLLAGVAAAAAGFGFAVAGWLE